MKATVSPSTRQCYPLTMICAVYRVPRSSLYLAKGATISDREGARLRG
jgi:hypothetical protein